jgi:hypothetical protein
LQLGTVATSTPSLRVSPRRRSSAARARGVTGSPYVKGRAALTRYWQAGLAGLDSLHFTLLSATCDAEAQGVVVHYIARLNGRPLRACEIFQFEAGRKLQADTQLGFARAVTRAGHHGASWRSTGDEQQALDEIGRDILCCPGRR